MGWLSKAVIAGLGVAVGTQLKPETRAKVGDAAKAVGEDLTRRLREEGTKVRKFLEEEVGSGPKSGPPPAPPAAAPAADPPAPPPSSV